MRALILTVFVGLAQSGWSQESPTPASLPGFPEVNLAPPISAPAEKPSPPAASSPVFPSQEPTPITLSPVQGQESVSDDPSKWRLHLGLESSVTYDDNIFIQPTQKVSDVYFGITPLIAAGWGSFKADPNNVTGLSSRFPQVAERDITSNAFYIRYDPTAVFFADHTDQNAFNEDVLVAGRWASGKLTLEAEGKFQTLSSPNIDVGNRINSEVTSGFLNANYQVAQKTTLDSRFALEHDSYQGGFNSTDTSLSTLLNYQVLPKTTVGLGVGLGYTTVESGQDQYYEQALLHVNYLPTYKISVDFVGGLEIRQIVNGPDRTTPVFNLDITYAAFDSTNISLSFSKKTDTSALFEGQDIEGTTVEARIRQRVFQKLYITVSGGFQHSEYVDAGAAANRSDNYSYFGVESSLEVTKWLSMKAGYHFQNNDSSFSEFGFRRNLADFQFNMQF